MGVCPICEKRISTKLNRHVEREHLPWLFNFTKACWSCKHSVTSACFLHRDHAHCTPPANLLNHRIWKTNALLHVIARCLNLPFLELLRNHIAARPEWYPWNDDCILSFEQRLVMRMWEAGNRHGKLVTTSTLTHLRLHHHCCSLSTTLEGNGLRPATLTH